MKLAEVRERIHRKRAEAERLDERVSTTKMCDFVLALLDQVDGVEAAGRHITAQEAGQILGLSANTVNRWCREGRFAGAFKISEAQSGGWRIPVQAVYDLQNRLRRGETRPRASRPQLLEA